MVWFGNLSPSFNLPPPCRILPPPFRIINGGGRFPNHTTMQGHLKINVDLFSVLHSCIKAIFFSLKFSKTNLFSRYTVRGLKLCSECCFYYFQTIIVFQHWMKNCWRSLNFANFFITDVSSRKIKNSGFLKLHYR